MSKFFGRQKLLLVLTVAACMLMSGVGEAATVRFVGVPSGVNNGLLTTGQGTSAATVNVYFQRGMTNFSALEVGVVVDGSGFTNNVTPLVTTDSSSFSNQKWEQGNTIMLSSLDGKGAFAPNWLTLKRKATSGAFTTAETVTFSFIEGVFPGPRTAIVNLTINPVPVDLPTAALSPVSLLMGTDYSGQNRVSVNFMGKDGKKVALGGMTLSLGSAPIAVNSAGSYVWDSATAVTVAPNVDSTGLLFATPQTGATTPKTPSTFSVKASTLNLPWDNNAIVGGIAAGTEFFSFNLGVGLGGAIALSSPGVNQFKVQQDAGNRTLKVTPTPSTINATGFKIAEADGSLPAASKTLNDLVITADPVTQTIKFSGTPSAVAPDTTYKVLWYVDAVNALSADLVVAIASADVYTAQLSSPLVDGLAQGVALLPGANDITVSLSPDVALSSLLISQDAAPFDGTQSWNGLVLSADIAAKKIVITGTPQGSGRQTFAVAAAVAAGVVSPSYLTFDVVVRDSLTSVTLDVVPKTLLLPVQLSADTKMDILATPASVDVFGTGAEISIGNTPTSSWNGLDIEPWVNVAHGTFWLRVTGKMTQPLVQEFNLKFINANGSTPTTTFTISGDIATQGSGGVFVAPGTPTLFDVDGSPLSKAQPGSFVEADYALKPGSGATIVAASIQAPGGAATTLSPLLDGTPQGDPGFLFDQVHNRLVVRNVPSVAGIYTITIYYELGGHIYTETATLKVGDTGEVPSTEALIRSVRITIGGTEHRGVFQPDGKTIVLELPEGTAITALSPRIVLSDGASIAPAGPYDFSRGGVTLTVTAEDGLTTKEYVLVVNLEDDGDVVTAKIVDSLASDAKATVVSNDDGSWNVDWRIRFDSSFDTTQLQSIASTVQELYHMHISYLDASGVETETPQPGGEYWLRIVGTANSRSALANVVLVRLSARKLSDLDLYVQDLNMLLREVPGGVPETEQPGKSGSSGGCDGGFAAAGLLVAAGAVLVVRQRKG